MVGHVADEPQIAGNGPDAARTRFRVVPEWGEPSGRPGGPGGCPRWFEVEAGNHDADVARRKLARGMRILIEGTIVHYVFKGEGVTRELVTRVRLESMRVLSGVAPGCPGERDDGARLES